MDNFNIEKEVWKDIPDFEGFYQVSNLGRVRSLDREFRSEERNRLYSLEGKVIKPYNSRGYRYVPLSKSGKVTKVSVHRLVAKTFISNPEKLEYVNHKDENKSNNRLENLEWCTPKYNTYYGDNSRIRPVMAINVTTGEKTIYQSMAEAERAGGFIQSNISATCRGRVKTHKGHYWKYLEEA